MKYKYIAGFDEVARSKLFGNLITATVIVPIGYLENIRFKINDSKKLSDKRVIEIFNKTKKYTQFIIGYIKPEEIENNNINLLEMQAVLNGIEIIKRVGLVEKFYINNFEVSEDKFWERMGEFKLDFDKKKVCLSHKSTEKVIQLASIYARYHELMENRKILNKFPEAGSGSPSDKKTIKFCLANKDNEIIRKRYLK
jgi:ribonuclease HII